MSKKHLTEYAFTPEWEGNRKENEPFVIWLRDLSLTDLEEIQKWEDKNEVQVTKDTLKRAVARIEGFNYGDADIKTLDELLSAKAPIGLLREIVERWLAGRPSAEKSNNEGERS